MKALSQFFSRKGRTLALIVILVPLLALFVYVALRSGPLAPVAITVTQVASKALKPAIFGIGTVEARYHHAIGPTAAGRLARLDVDVGDPVRKGQVLGEMDPVDLNDRLLAQEAAVERARSGLAEAQARLDFARVQAQRYEKLWAVKSTSQEAHAIKRQELRLAEVGLTTASRELDRLVAERQALISQRQNLRLVAPVNGVVVKRDIDPGTTVVAGQAVLEIVDPQHVWVNARFDQISATGLQQGLFARVQLRSRRDQALEAKVVRVEMLADSVTEELLAKLSFVQTLEPLPALGELAEVTVDLAPLPVAPVIPNAAVRRDGNQSIVWKIANGAQQRVPVTLGVIDLDGNVQVIDGLADGDVVVVYSDGAITAQSPVRIVDRIPGVSP